MLDRADTTELVEEKETPATKHSRPGGFTSSQCVENKENNLFVDQCGIFGSFEKERRRRAIPHPKTDSSDSSGVTHPSRGGDKSRT